jgi:myo-inositol 2-dehydrogenase / D-chiro-inositol 1-dehydrogenase
MSREEIRDPARLTRRSFLHGSSLGLLAAAGATGVGAAPRGAGVAAVTDAASALGDREITVALVGCGGRGTGAAAQVLKTTGPVRLVAMADAFENRLTRSLETLVEHSGKRVDVPQENRYVGFDGYRKAIESGADLVILATPPGFRPAHFEHAVAAGRHVFMEKPVAVDAPGVRRVLAASAEADRRGLKVGVGLQRHHDPAYLETVARLRDGAIGELLAYRVYWNSSGVWVNPRQAGESEMTYQMRNWYYFNWLCGDHIVEQHIHNMDVANWIHGAYPVEAQAQGGREVRRGPQHGEIYDHFSVEYTYADGAVMLSQCRHIPDCWESVAEHVHGSRGTADVSGGIIRPRGGEVWRWREEPTDPYQLEQDALLAAIRAGTPFNETENGAKSTLTAILGRMAAYSGQRVTWDQALLSNLDLSPARLDWDADPPVLPGPDGEYAVAVPGRTEAL